MPPRGSVRDPETGKYYPEGSEHAQEILTARATVKNIPVDVAQNLTTEVKELQTPSTQTSDEVSTPMVLLPLIHREDHNASLNHWLQGEA